MEKKSLPFFRPESMFYNYFAQKLTYSQQISGSSSYCGDTIFYSVWLLVLFDVFFPTAIHFVTELFYNTINELVS